MQTFKYRDLTVVDISPDQRMVISCDSSGGIGNKEMDVVKADPETVGYYATQVAIMELLATGAKPVSVVNTLGVEMNDTGKKIINGIKKALQPLNLGEDIIVTGSTEENIPVCQTSMGITAIGIVERSNWRGKRAKKRDIVASIGLPKVGNEVLEDMGRETMSIPLLTQLLQNPNIGDILPVGSKGIVYELGVMASSNDVDYNLYNVVNVDLYKSAGPSTCVIVSIDRDYYDELKASINIPVNFIGILI